MDLQFNKEGIIFVSKMLFTESTKESSDEYIKTYNILRYGDIAFEGNKSKNFSYGRFVYNNI